MRSHSVFVAVFGLVTGACSAAGPSRTDAEPSPSDRSAAEAELGRVTQALGEPTCGTIAADDTLDYPSGRVGAGAPDGNYGHPECKDGYVVDVTNVPAGAKFSGGAFGPRWPDPFTCLLNWGYLSIWKKDGSGY